MEDKTVGYFYDEELSEFSRQHHSGPPTKPRSALPCLMDHKGTFLTVHQ